MDINNQPPPMPQLTTADQQVMQTACLICRYGFHPNEVVYACPYCRGFHHTNCWESRLQCPSVQAPAYAPWPTGNPNASPAQPLSYSNYGGNAAPADVPGLPWVVVLLLAVVTCGLFLSFWAIWQGVWAKKVEPSSNAVLFYSLSLATGFIGGGLSAFDDIAVLGGILSLGSSVLVICGNFSVRQTIETQFNRSLSGVMTFFFGAIYHQYHFNEVAKMKSTNWQ
ncbi:MAG TPA: hypothetical protein PLD20_35180 [Blastocatellia bacterium]|nr:hypothetical protein [Blastocatellia bacterium]HMV84052.1 hypothetical protein [Blastocatellia bacterium]HMX29156.1 hypothetical protein [Blastocatellia bacterium]HMY74718.1 hypothetical protein [Blastocatellia bacterium]HMZ23221.1 hypothetical protein [Blastocatellia bacterium]